MLSEVVLENASLDKEEEEALARALEVTRLEKESHQVQKIGHVWNKFKPAGHAALEPPEGQAAGREATMGAQGGWLPNFLRGLQREVGQKSWAEKLGRAHKLGRVLSKQASLDFNGG